MKYIGYDKLLCIKIFGTLKFSHYFDGIIQQNDKYDLSLTDPQSDIRKELYNQCFFITTLTLYLFQHQELCSQEPSELLQRDLHPELPWFAGSLRSYSTPWHIARS